MLFQFRTFQKIIFLPVLVLGFFAIAFFARAAGNLSGYAWADTGIGWISFNCSNTGVCGTSNYGVTVAPNGTMSGYAWANPNDGGQNHIGWINFNPSGPYPASSFVPSQSVRMNPGVGTVRGWARAVSYDIAGGWDGWIGFGSGGNYGSGVTVSGCSWNGYGWGGGTDIGWIHFANATVPAYGVTGSGNGCVPSFDYSLSNSGDITVTAGSSGFNIITRILNAGAAAGITVSASGLPVGASVQSITNNPCSPSCSSTLTITTLASTAAGTYSITVTGAPLGKTTNFNLIVNAPPLAPSGLSIDAASLTTCGAVRLTWNNVSGEDNYSIERNDGGWHEIATPVVDDIDFDDTTVAQNTSYLYRVRAHNVFGWSGYSNIVSGNNQSPSANFSWSPVTVRPNQSVLFTDTSLAYGAGVSIATRAWTFQDGTPPVSSISPQTVSFTGAGQKTVTLQVRDSSNRICGPIEKIPSLSAGSGIPVWIEEPPR